MSKENRANSGFVYILGVQTLLAVVAILIIVFGGVELGIGGLSIFTSIIAGTFAGIAMYGAIFFALRLSVLSRFKENLGKNVGKVHLSWLQIIAISVFAGVAEELLFRAAIQTWVASHTNIYIGVLLASVLFGIAHFSSISYVLLTLVIGVVMGAAYHLSQSIEFVIVWHIVADIVGLSIFVKYPGLLGGEARTT